MTSSPHEIPDAIGKPARNALLAADINSLQQVALMSDKELIALHGVGPKAIRILHERISQTQ